MFKFKKLKSEMFDFFSLKENTKNILYVNVLCIYCFVLPVDEQIVRQLKH